MKNRFPLFVLSVFALASCGDAAEKAPTSNAPATTETQEASPPLTIEILDPEALEVIDAETEVEVLAEGFTWTEGPLWLESEKSLLFSDIPKNRVVKLDMNGDTSTYLQPSGGSEKSDIIGEPGSNGLVLSPDGALVLMQHGDRRVARMDAPLSAPEEKYISLINNYQGKRFNSPNDGTYDASGNIYFTDPPYGLPGLMDDPNKELSFQGVYCLKASGELVLLDSLTRPNGLALSADGAHMYVAVSDPSHAVWYQYDVVSPGVVKNKKIFYDLTHLVGKPGQQGLPDGLKVNSKGYIFATGAGGVWIFNSAAKPLARIHTGQLTANCALRTDEKRLFMTADDYIMAVDLK